MGTTWGPTERSLRQRDPGRPGPGAKVIPLSSAKQRYAPRTPQAFRQHTGPRVVPWPHQDEAVARPQATPSARRRRRSASIRQWLPTIVFAGIVGLLVILLV